MFQARVAWCRVTHSQISLQSHTHAHTHIDKALAHTQRSAGFTLQPYLFLHTATLKAGDLNNMACQEIESKLKKKYIMSLFKFKNLADKAGLN